MNNSFFIPIQGKTLNAWIILGFSMAVWRGLGGFCSECLVQQILETAGSCSPSTVQNYVTLCAAETVPSRAEAFRPVVTAECAVWARVLYGAVPHVASEGEKKQEEGLEDSVLSSLNPCPETITLGKYSRICHQVKLLMNKQALAKSFCGIESLSQTIPYLFIFLENYPSESKTHSFASNFFLPNMEVVCYDVDNIDQVKHLSRTRHCSERFQGLCHSALQSLEVGTTVILTNDEETETHEIQCFALQLKGTAAKKKRSWDLNPAV